MIYKTKYTAKNYIMNYSDTIHLNYQKRKQ